jgi:predicted nucleic acid-binding protein
MDIFVLDTVALVRYLEDDLSKSADRVFSLAEEGGAKLLIPSIVMGEFIYLALKGRLRVKELQPTIIELLHNIEASGYLLLVDMTLDSWQKFLNLNVPELHDRMICAIAASRNAAVVTNDPEIRADGIPTIW